jgi:hypothetical protein
MPRRSKIETLPKAVKAWLDAALVEGNFSGYELLEAEIKAKGYQIGKSSIHRYGSEFERKLATLKLASEQARAIVTAAPDDEGAVSEALMRLVQEKLFQVMLNFEVDPDKPLNIAAAAKAVAELARATINQKRWQAETRDKIGARMDALESEASKGNGSFDLNTLRRVREEIYGIV